MYLYIISDNADCRKTLYKTQSEGCFATVLTEGNLEHKYLCLGDCAR